MRTEKAMRGKSAWVIFLLGLFLVQPFQSAWAGDWYIVPRLELRGEYDSNINFSFENKKDDFIFNITPSVDLNYESEITKLTGRLRLNGQVFVNNGNLDTINQYYDLFGQHRVAPRLALTFDGGYTLDSTLYEELFASGFVMNRTRREALRIRPGLIYDLSPRLSLGLNYGYLRVTYQDPQFSPYFTHRVSSNIRYLLGNAKTTLYGTVLGRYTDYHSIGNLYRSLGTYVGLEHKFSEEWFLNLGGGLNFNWYSSQTAVIGTVFDPTFILVPLRATRKTFNVSPYFNIAATRRWPNTDLTVSYNLDQAASSAGTIRQFHRVNAEIARKLTPKLRVGLQGSLYYALTTAEEENENQRMVFYISPGITYQITDRLSISSAYNYGLRNDIDDNRSTDRHRVWVYLAYAYPIQYKK